MAEITTQASLLVEFQPRLQAALLKQPDKTYVLASMLEAALAQSDMERQNPESFSVLSEQLRSGRPVESGIIESVAEAFNNGTGGPLMLQPSSLLYPGIFNVVRELQRGLGDTVLLNRPKYASTTTTLAAARYRHGTPFFGSTSQAIGMEQVRLTLDSFVGPQNADGSHAPFAIDLTAQVTSFHNLLSMCQLHITRHRTFWLDSILIAMLIAAADAVTGHTIRGGGKTANADFTGQGNEPFEWSLLTQMARQFSDDAVPGINNGKKWIAVLNPRQIEQLSHDAEYQRLSAFHKEANPLFPGWTAETNEWVILNSNNMPTLSSIGVPGTLTGYQGLALAPDVFGYARRMLRVMRNNNDDGGLVAEFGWHAIEAFAVLQDRYVGKWITT